MLGEITQYCIIRNVCCTEYEMSYWTSTSYIVHVPSAKWISLELFAEISAASLI